MSEKKNSRNLELICSSVDIKKNPRNLDSIDEKWYVGSYRHLGVVIE